MVDAGLYIHVPFCRTKCGYCDFYSRVPAEGQTGRYVDAVLTELAGGPAAPGGLARVRTIFVGGGTPTILPVVELSRLFGALGELARRDGVSEFTVEANPASLDDAKSQVLREAGVNRVSIGVQSFAAGELRTLGRRHQAEDVAPTVRLVQRWGFSHINLDLIFGIPGQTEWSWGESLRRAIDLGPDHIACYGLTYEPGTPLDRRWAEGAVDPCGEEAEARMYECAIDTLTGAGFEHYEISNFARPGARCEHNLAYWRNEPYVGLGPAAASYFDGVRTRNVADIEQYIRRISLGQSPVIESERLGARARAGETAMLQLRLTDGIDRRRFERQTGFDALALFADVIPSHVAGRRLSVTPTHIRLTRSGLLIADSVMADFIAVGVERGLTAGP
ncbi:MAG: radical SAM family heme chaperone HemW [Phycisphaerae bacterium]